MAEDTTWGDGRTFNLIMRRSSENHAETPPDCDAKCARWGDRAHGHVCPDGLYDPGPLLTLTTWCSCGYRIGLLRYDVTKPLAAGLVEDFGLTTGRDFREHMLAAHDIDVETDEDWLRRLETAPGGD
jgi:hypothetical protein